MEFDIEIRHFEDKSDSAELAELSDGEIDIILRSESKVRVRVLSRVLSVAVDISDVLWRKGVNAGASTDKRLLTPEFVLLVVALLREKLPQRPPLPDA